MWHAMNALLYSDLQHAGMSPWGHIFCCMIAVVLSWYNWWKLLVFCSRQWAIYQLAFMSRYLSWISVVWYLLMFGHRDDRRRRLDDRRFYDRGYPRRRSPSPRNRRFRSRSPVRRRSPLRSIRRSRSPVPRGIGRGRSRSRSWTRSRSRSRSPRRSLSRSRSRERIRSRSPGGRFRSRSPRREVRARSPRARSPYRRSISPRFRSRSPRKRSRSLGSRSPKALSPRRSRSGSPVRKGTSLFY